MAVLCSLLTFAGAQQRSEGRAVLLQPLGCQGASARPQTPVYLLVPLPQASECGSAAASSWHFLRGVRGNLSSGFSLAWDGDSCSLADGP